ncbi:MAG: DedA family protein [Acidithiobacillus sp.]
MEKTACFFKRHGPVAVMLGRFIVPLRQLQGYVAGSAKMGFWRFAWWSLLGAMAWVLVWGLVGWWVGDMYHWRKKKGHMDPIASNLPGNAL